MVVHLVGLGGSLEGRVAGVVLVLVGCKEEIAGQLCCSCSACVRILRWCSYSAHILIQAPLLFLPSTGAPVSE